MRRLPAAFGATFALLLMGSVESSALADMQAESTAVAANCTPAPLTMRSSGRRGGGSAGSGSGGKAAASPQPAALPAPPSMVCSPVITVTVPYDASARLSGSGGTAEALPCCGTGPDGTAPPTSATGARPCCTAVVAERLPPVKAPDSEAMKKALEKAVSESGSETSWKIKFMQIEAEFKSKNLTFIYITLGITGLALVGFIVYYVLGRKREATTPKVSAAVPIAILVLVIGALLLSWRWVSRGADEDKFIELSKVVRESISEVALTDSQIRTAMDAGLAEQARAIRTEMALGNEALQRQLAAMSQQLRTPSQLLPPVAAMPAATSASFWLPFVGVTSALGLAVALAYLVRAMPLRAELRAREDSKLQSEELKRAKYYAEQEAEAFSNLLVRALRAKEEEKSDVLDYLLVEALDRIGPLEQATIQMVTAMGRPWTRAYRSPDMGRYAGAKERLLETLKPLLDALDEFLVALDSDYEEAEYRHLLRATRSLRRKLALLQR